MQRIHFRSAVISWAANLRAQRRVHLANPGSQRDVAHVGDPNAAARHDADAVPALRCKAAMVFIPFTASVLPPEVSSRSAPQAITSSRARSISLAHIERAVKRNLQAGGPMRSVLACGPVHGIFAGEDAEHDPIDSARSRLRGYPFASPPTHGRSTRKSPPRGPDDDE